MYSLENSIIIDSPVKGIYFAGNTPKHYKKSHKTDFFGQTYAIDLMQTKSSGFIKPWNYLNLLYLTGISSKWFECWDKEIFSPFDGIVVHCKNEKIDSKWNLIPLMMIYKYKLKQIKKDVIRIRRILPYFEKRLPFPNENTKQEILEYMCGNYVIIKKDNAEVYCLIAHMKEKSLKVKKGQQIKIGEIIGNIGNTGNSEAPHIHFHLCDSDDLWKAKGIPFIINRYRVKRNKEWIIVENQIPDIKEEIVFGEI